MIVNPVKKKNNQLTSFCTGTHCNDIPDMSVIAPDSNLVLRSWKGPMTLGEVGILYQLWPLRLYRPNHMCSRWQSFNARTACSWTDNSSRRSWRHHVRQRLPTLPWPLTNAFQVCSLKQWSLTLKLTSLSLSSCRVSSPTREAGSATRINLGGRRKAHKAWHLFQPCLYWSVRLPA